MLNFGTMHIVLYFFSKKALSLYKTTGVFSIFTNATNELTYSYKKMINPEERLEIVEKIVKNSMEEIKRLHIEG
jgi:hypothetical protein